MGINFINTLSNSKSQPEYVPVEFSGNSNDYFRIWIVNLALTIVTLGIYSAWAKVRKERYFYTHTKIADGTFDYHASPKAILFGRIIAMIFLGLYLGAGYVHPYAPFAIVLLVFLIVPWLVVRSRIFRMRVSSYRGIRFNFKPAYAEAFKVYYGAALVTVFSFGLATATANHMRSKFSVAFSGFGRTDFKFAGEHSVFVAIFWKTVGLSILVVLALGTISVFLIAAMPRPSSAGDVTIATQLLIFAAQLPIILGYLAVGVFYQVRLRNYVWNTSKLGENDFMSNLSVGEMIGIYMSNFLAIVFSLGLLIPWAQIRLAKYRADHLKVGLADDWENYIAADGNEGSALGDEIGEAFDVDIDLGF